MANKHSAAFVRLQFSPDLKGRIDLGAVAEALVYYDCVFLGTVRERAFSEFVGRFQQEDAISELGAFFREGVIRPVR